MANGSSLDPQSRLDRVSEIRRLALSHLASPRDGFDVRAHLDELAVVAPNDEEQRNPIFMEAFILLIVATGRAPRRAQKTLYRLFRERAGSGQIEAHERFEMALRYAVRDESMLESLFFHRALCSLDAQSIWSDVGTTIEKLRGLVGEAFLNSGTLLGVVRDKKLIAYDDDVDLAVRLKATTAEGAAAEWKEIRANLAEIGLLSKAKINNHGVCKLKSNGVFNIDLFPAWVSDGHAPRLERGS